MGTAFFGVKMKLLFGVGEDLQRYEELEAVVKVNAFCLVEETGFLGWIG